jgi:hypothetical protein
MIQVPVITRRWANVKAGTVAAPSRRRAPFPELRVERVDDARPVAVVTVM